MEEPYVEGVASRHGPELCVGGGNSAGEALTGESAGRLLSSEITGPGRRESADRGRAREGPERPGKRRQEARIDV